MSPSTDLWSNLARTHGPRCVMSLTIDDATFAAETERQIGLIMPMLRPHLRGGEMRALDYGCGHGRFTGALADLFGAGSTLGYDPCRELLPTPAPSERLAFATGDPDSFFATMRASPCFDVVFTAMVLGDPNLNLLRVVADLASILAPGGLAVIIDHMPEVEPTDRWWRFRPAATYIAAFAAHGIALRCIGQDRQLENAISVLAGRKV